MNKSKVFTKIESKKNEELDIYLEQGHYVNISENEQNGITIYLNEQKDELVKIVVNGKKVYENYDEKIILENKKLWPLLKTINWDKNKENDIYFYNQYGRDILVIIEENGDIGFRVDYTYLPNIKNVYPLTSEEEINELVNIENYIYSICKDNDYRFVFSHFMEKDTGDGCWSDIVIPKEVPLEINALNYLFYLSNKMEEKTNNLYKKHQ